MPLTDPELRALLARAAPHGPVDAAIAAIAGHQDGTVATRQLRVVGVTAGGVRRRVVAGRLHPLLRGTHAVGHPNVGRRGWWHAALLLGGADAALSHRTGGEHWGVVPPRPGPVHVTVPGAKGRRARGARWHSGTLHPEDVVVRDGLPVTSLPRTLLDLAEDLTLRGLVDALDRAEARRLYDPAEMEGVLARARGRRGQRALRRALLVARPQDVLTRSRLERRALRLIAAHRLPRPEVNALVQGYEVDLVWRASRLAVELDGRAWHGDGVAFERDRRRDTTLLVQGWRVARFTWRQVVDQPEWVAASLRRLLDHGGG